MAYLISSELFQTLELLVFVVLICYTAGSAFLAVTVKSVYHAVLWLVFTLLGVAMFFLLYAESALLLVIQMIVYAGGITVLLLFAISISGKEAMFEKSKDWKLMDKRLSFGGAFILFIIVYYVLTEISTGFWKNQTLPSGDLESQIQLIENLVVQLFTVHGGTIIILGLLLSAAMLGSVYLVKKEVEDI